MWSDAWYSFPVDARPGRRHGSSSSPRWTDKYVNSVMHQRLLALGREALVAHGGSPEHPSRSGQGGIPLGLPGERWPLHHDEALFPVLILHTPELPIVPRFLAGSLYWVFFIKPDEYEHSTSDGGLVVRRYSDMSSLVALDPPVEASRERLGFSFQTVTDYPSRAALERILGETMDHFDDDAFPCHSGIKLAGWPLLIQSTAFLATDAPDFEIQLDGSELYTYADSGIGYVYGGLEAIHWETM
jgi:hypothetical protein